MPQAIKKRRAKPAKPYDDFPMFPAPNGQWCKKILGRPHYFGVWADADAALKKYLDQKDDLFAGRTPRRSDEMTVAVLVDRYLNVKLAEVKRGELSQRHWNDIYATGARIVAALGKNRTISDLRADDFEKLRNKFPESWGPATQGNEIQRTRSLFKYAYEAEHLEKPIRFGPAFKRPNAKVMRKARQERGPVLFTAPEIRTMLKKAGTQLKAMILLGINCGMGNHDVGSLPTSAVDLKRGWHNFARPKTGMPRRCPLWPETVTAIKTALKERPEPKSADDAGILFITKKKNRWSRPRPKRKDPKVIVWQDSVGLEFGKLLRAADMKRPAHAFYALRHTFRTVADQVKDQPAADIIMGHVPETGDMAAMYREEISDDRLLAITKHVRSWLWRTK